MNVAEWIIVGILSFTLFVFLIVGIILFVKLIGLTKDAKVVLAKGEDVIDRAQDIADKAHDIADRAEGVVKNARRWTSVGSLAKSFVRRYNRGKASKSSSKGK